MTPFSHEVLRLRPCAGVFSRDGSLPRAYADHCIHVGRGFFFAPPSKGFFFQPERNNSSGTTADGSSHSEAGGGAQINVYTPEEVLFWYLKRVEKPERVVRGLTPGSTVSGFSSAPCQRNVLSAAAARQGNEINTARRSNALLTCRLVVF